MSAQFIGHSTRTSNQYNKTRKGNKKHIYWKERN